jgi:DNA-binding NarL/FixJ family response regulator
MPSSLSSSESAVAELAARGLSNSEIAAERGTSTRTVANQLGSVFAKLGIASRAELPIAIAGLRDDAQPAAES